MSGGTPVRPEREGEARLTFAIPYARSLPYLELAIESVLAQNDPAWLLLVCDDSGCGEAEDLVARYDDARIRYTAHPSRLGMVGNWNHCIDAAVTEFVTLLHGDDELGPGYTSLILALARLWPEATAYFCDAAIIDADGRARFSLADATKRFFLPRGGEDVVVQGRAGVAALMRGNFIMCPTLCFRKSRLGERRFSEDWQQVQDLELTTRLLMDGDLIVGRRKQAYRYRRHRASATAQQSESLLRFDEEFRLFDRVAEAARSRGWHDVSRIGRRKTIVRLHLLYLALGDAAALRTDAGRHKLRLLFAGRHVP